MLKRGWALAHDYVRIPGKHVVYEIDQDSLASTPIGLVSTPEAVSWVKKYAHTERQGKNAMVRPRDIVDLGAIARKTGRHKSTIVGRWMKHRDFPKPVVKLGVSAGWYWPDVQAWMEVHGLKVTKKRGVEGRVV